MNLGVLIDNAVQRFGDRIALSDARRRVSYSQLGERIHRLGNGLAAIGVRHGDRIASLQHNCLEAMEFDIMAAKFGFVRTLLNARADVSSHIHCINACKAKVLVFEEKFADLLAGIRDLLPGVEHYVCVGGSSLGGLDYEELIERSPAAPPEYEVTSTDWHSIYFTSGTTGKSKGVVLDQRNWLVVVRNHLLDVYADSNPDDVVLHAAPLSHSSGVLTLSQLVRGARQHVMYRFNPGEMLELIEKERVTTTFLAPTMIYKLLEHPDIRKRDMSSLRTIRYGAAPMAVDRVLEALKVWGPVLVQSYGQWEAPQFFTSLNKQQHAHAVATGKHDLLRSAGRALSFVRIGVMNEAGELLPPMTPGEVVTAGDHLMLGYLDAPDETAALRAGIWQRTGDVGYIDDAGFLFLTDRKKDFILTGGNNVYPRDVEEVLFTHPAVQEAAVIGIPDETWGETVHAVIVVRPGQVIDDDAFLAWCAGKLSTDKRPRSLTRVEELPKNEYGKVLRRTLREPYWNARERKV